MNSFRVTFGNTDFVSYAPRSTINGPDPIWAHVILQLQMIDQRIIVFNATGMILEFLNRDPGFGIAPR